MMVTGPSRSTSTASASVMVRSSLIFCREFCIRALLRQCQRGGRPLPVIASAAKSNVSAEAVWIASSLRSRNDGERKQRELRSSALSPSRADTLPDSACWLRPPRWRAAAAAARRRSSGRRGARRRDSRAAAACRSSPAAGRACRHRPPRSANESGVITSSIRMMRPSLSRPNSNLVSAMMMPCSRASSSPSV